MERPTGLRERKKQETRRLLMATALDLFERRGFDEVSVAEVAEAANVSKATVFNYFATKEDLVLAGAKEHVDEPARIVRERPVGQTPHGAMREYCLAMLERRLAVSGLSVHPLFRRVMRIVPKVPSLQLRGMQYRKKSEQLLAEALIAEGSPEITAQLVASQLIHTQHILATGNIKRINAGESPDAVYPEAVAAVNHAFGLLEHGIGDFMRREAEPGDPTRDDVTTVDTTWPTSGGTGAAERFAERAVEEAVDDALRSLTRPDHP